jgi:predicted PurR-regulated permease PerM
MTPPLEPLPGRSVSISLRSWAIGAAVVALAVLVWDVVERSLSSFVLLFTAMLLAEALRPPIDRLGKHISREAAVGIVFATVIVLSLLVTVVLVQPLGSELVKLVASVPDYVLSLQTKLAEAQRFIKADAAFWIWPERWPTRRAASSRVSHSAQSAAPRWWRASSATRC